MHLSISQLIVPVLALTNLVYALPVGGNNDADLADNQAMKTTYADMQALKNQDKTAATYAGSLAKKYNDAPKEDRSPLRLLQDYQTLSEIGQRCAERLTQYKDALQAYEWPKDKDAEIRKFAETNLALQEKIMESLAPGFVAQMLDEKNFEAEAEEDLNHFNDPEEENTFLGKEIESIREKLDASKEALEKNGDGESFRGRFLELQVWIHQKRLNAYSAKYKKED